MQGCHGGLTQIPYTVPYTPTKNTVQYRTFSEKTIPHRTMHKKSGTVHCIRYRTSWPPSKCKAARVTQCKITNTSMLSWAVRKAH